ncbi:DUF3500 domain-containing protein [Rothia endophytica]|uniref:Uncharacterized protein n=1 Tax=Rothia endophytica TaxID=1324766 RepID=A0ABP9BSP3_9MICC
MGLTAQKELLLELIRNYAGMADDETWATQKAAIEATLDETYVCWEGATSYDTSIDGGIYFKISGPNVYIEFIARVPQHKQALTVKLPQAGATYSPSTMTPLMTTQTL